MKKNIISAILLAALSLVLVFVLCAPAFASDSQPSDQASEPAVLSAPNGYLKCFDLLPRMRTGKRRLNYR